MFWPCWRKDVRAKANVQSSPTQFSGPLPFTRWRTLNMGPTRLYRARQPLGWSSSLGNTWQVMADGRILWNPKSCPLSMQGLLGNSLIGYVSFPGPKFPFRLAALPSTPLSKALCSMQFRTSGSPLKTLTSSGKLQ